MRLDRPYAALYFLLPQVAGCLQVAVLNDTSPTSLARALLMIGLFTFFFRGATCAWNDTVDVRFDAKVTRTKHRPLARGAMSVTTAAVFTCLLTLGAVLLLLWLPQAAQYHGILWIIGAAVYPLSKRVTWYPQFVCGVVLAWGVCFGASVLDVEAFGFSLEWISKITQFKKFPEAKVFFPKDQSWPVIFLYLSNVAWTICYETVYSYADVKDDRRAGVKNIALLMKRYAKVFLVFIATASVLFMATAGALMQASVAFFSSSVVGFGMAMGWKLYQVKLEEPASCLKWFMLGGMTAGALMITGLGGEYAVRLLL